MPELSIRYEAAPTLGRFLGSNAFVRAVVGPVGSGKSSACVVELLRRATKQVRGPDGFRRTRFAVIRNTYRELKDTTRKTFEQWIPHELGQWHEQEFRFDLQFKDVRSEILFRALDRPIDAKKLLSLELTGAYVNEAREIPKTVFELLTTRVGRYPSKVQGACTWSGIWLDTNPWARTHWGYGMFREPRPEGYELFEQPGALEVGAENLDNLPLGYYERLSVKKSVEWLKSYRDGKYPDSDEGSYFGAQIALLDGAGGICDFEVIPFDVFTTWDLGIDDSTAIWFWRLRDGLPEVVDYYEESGQALSHYFAVIDSKGYRYVKHWLPHDARNRTYQTGVSTLDLVRKRYGQGAVAIGPELSLQDGIQASRWLLEQPIRIHRTNCAQGIEALKSYHKEWDEEAKCFGNHPVHDWSSHGADAWRGVACVAQGSEIMMRRPEPAVRPAISVGSMSGSFTLDELFEERERGRI